MTLKKKDLKSLLDTSLLGQVRSEGKCKLWDQVRRQVTYYVRWKACNHLWGLVNVLTGYQFNNNNHTNDDSN
jgi:hypothetical protein